ncbi:MAG TPA: polysaccharide biosynthesis tyrosine autokinase, partial [Gemmatimonadaceae bacterium]
FDKKIEWDDVKHDIALLKSVIAGAKNDSVPNEALLQIRSVASGAPVAQTLRNAVAQFHTKEGELAQARVNLTDEHPTVRTLVSQLNDLKNVQIPTAANQLLTSLELHEVDDSVRIAGAGANLQQIPQRTIQEEQLRRNRDVYAGIYMNLQNRHSEALLAEESATPDISVLDTAIAPLAPTANTAPRVMMMAIVGGIGVAIGLAILLDMMDGRIRYADQVTDEIGLPIAGTVPKFPKGGANANSPEQMFQLVESFRSLRMAVVNANGGPPPISFAVSSPSPGDGKSLISANMAMSFADAGLRTILVDGDTRRGALHEMFDLGAVPGLTDYLGGRASQQDVIYATADPMLSIIPCGRRQRRSPEMLTSPLLPRLVADLRSMFDVVVFDTPPLAAGIDGYSIAAATGHLLLVLRVGKTERRMTMEKMRVFDRLPVNLVGAVLNGIQLTDGYEYYGYVPGYEASDETPGTALAEIR